MGLTIRKVLLGGALLCAGAGAADATIVHETYTGTISFGMEPNGRFGAPTANLSGKTLTIAFRFDLGAGGSSTDDGSTSASYGGGPDEGSPTVATVKVSVGRATRDFGGAATAAYLAFYHHFPSHDAFGQSQSLDQLDAEAGSTTYVAIGHVSSLVDDFVASRVVGTHVDFTAPGSFYSEALVYDNSGFEAYTTGNPVHVTVTSSGAAVSEPATLALFGLGAGLLAAMRRR